MPKPTRATVVIESNTWNQLAAVIPHLRAFGRSLSGSRDLADDLVQETLLKAWAARKRFQAGTNMRAWTFIILRNLFLSQMRRARFKGEWDELTASKLLAAPASQDRHVELGDMQRALMYLPQPEPMVESLCRCVAADGFVSIMALNAKTLAVRAALDMQAAAQALQPQFREMYGFDFQPEIGIDTGPVIEGEKTIEQMGEEILEYCIRAASGEVIPKAVLLNQDDFIPWKRGVSL